MDVRRNYDNEHFDKPHRIKTNKKNVHTVQKVSFNQLPTTNSGRNYVTELQKQIEAKNAEIESLTMELARNDKVNMDSIQADLNRLQVAFDHVAKINSAKLDPVVQQYNQSTADYESKIFSIDLMKNAAQERYKSREKMQDLVADMTHQLHVIDFKPISETSLIQSLKLLNEQQDEIESIHTTFQFANRNNKLGTIINQNLEERLKQEEDREKQAQKRMQSLKDELNAHVGNISVVIDDEWVLARHSTHKLHLMLEDAKRSIKFLRETAEQLATNNKKTEDELNVSKEELKTLSKYFPDSDHTDISKKTPGVSRSDLTILQAEKDYNEIILGNARKKTMALKGTLESLNGKIDELSANLEKSEDEIEQTRIERENIEKEIERILNLHGELVSRKEFVIEQGKLLDQRIEEQKKILEDMKARTTSTSEEIERQKNAIQLNEEMNKLKSMNIGRYTSTLENLIKYQNRVNQK